MLVHAIEIAKVVAQEKLLKNYSQVQKLSESSFRKTPKVFSKFRKFLTKSESF